VATCPSCAHEVPEGRFCVRCGADLADEKGRRRGFAAASNERASVPRIVSSLFPQLPRSDMDTFRVALGVGTVLVLGLGIAGLYPLALIAAALLVPILTVLYLYDVDVYEDQPLIVLAFTVAWGALCGVGMAILARELGAGTEVFSNEDPVLRGVVLPLTSAALMLAGPLVLLPYRRFNDVLDGATFGAASAVSFVGAQALTYGFSLLDAGLRPVGETLPWLARLGTVALAQPILAMAAIGAAAAALWLRYRAPVADRRALGVLGHPLVAVPAAFGLIVAGAIGQTFLPVGLWLLWLTALAAVALIGLRRAIHLGLRQEASEVAVGPEIQCANCEHRTARHTFCQNCGIALQALPKGGPGTRRPGAAPGAQRPEAEA